MSTKSTTQMTKRELIEVIREKNVIIGVLNEKIDSLELAQISSEVHAMSSESSKFLESLVRRIRNLESQLSK